MGMKKKKANFRGQFASVLIFAIAIYITTVLSLFIYTGRYDWNVFQSTALPKFAIVSCVTIVIIFIVKFFQKGSR